MSDYQAFSLELSQLLDETYGYLDLEVDGTRDEIYRFGLVSPLGLVDADPTQAEQVRSHLQTLYQNQGGLCGHNIRRFDYPHLLRQWADLEPLPMVDTLELSVLALPLQTSHKLQKDYKLSQYASNNPLEDAQATRLLLQHLLQVLSEQPQSLQAAYRWLLTCGEERADFAYRQLFKLLDLHTVSPPGLDELPAGAIAGMRRSVLEKLWDCPDGIDFESRLSVAALLSWNYACQETQTRPIQSAWLCRLPDFDRVLELLFPLADENGFTYQPYLQEFGIPTLYAQQEAAVQAILDRQRPLILMATGGGKSLCYQLPALMFHRQQQKLTVCVSPLQALMEDQVADLEAAGLDFATFINSTLSAEERSQRIEQVYEGWKGLLYISPEQLRSISIRTLLQKRPPALWVIDEAHCISQWGHDFRPDYRYIPKFIQDLYAEQQLLMPRLALLTATATQAVRADMQKLFAQHDLEIRQEIVAEIRRDNLTYQVIALQDKEQKDQAVLTAVQEAIATEGAVLVYTTTRKDAERLAGLLNRHDIQARYYHGKMPRQDKNEVLQAFKRQELNVVTATCAFGMGINRKDVRAVIHHTLSSSLEAYTQEAGRAGRDRQPATCTLLFNEEDANTIFFLKSLSRMSDADLRNIFFAVRNLRDRIHKSDRVSEDWFWVTPDEIVQSSTLNEQFATEDEQRDTKIKVALHYLEERFKLLERAETLSSFVQFSLVHRTPQESWRQFERYHNSHHLAATEVKQFERLIYAMHLVRLHYQQQDEPLPLERLSDEAGIPVQQLTSRIQELQRAGVCLSKIPLALSITKGVKGDARIQHDRLRQIEQDLLEALLPLMGDRTKLQLNLRGLATRLDPDRSRKISANLLMDLLEGWRSLKWVTFQRINTSVIRLEKFEVIDWLTRHQNLSRLVLELLYEKLGREAGARMRLEYDLGELLADVQQRTQPIRWTDADLKAVLLWLHQRQILRLTEGLNLFHQAFKVRVFRGASVATITKGYSDIEELYHEQTLRTHLMVLYGRLHPDDRLKLIDDYFKLPPEEFTKNYTDVLPEPLHPVTQDVYDRIMKPLNEAQREIVTANHPAMVVIAGPGSGKTRTIVHRIAYLVMVKQVQPDRILVLAYNRNAVRSLRLRLQQLLGAKAACLRVYTFHSLALSLLGQTLGQAQKARNNDATFDQLLKEACDLLEQNDENDVQVQRNRLLKNVEHIFVDEYQDVAANEYRLIQLLSGLGQSEDETRSVQVNLCAIGDDDQNIYEFKNTSPQYIIQFEAEYQAKRLLLTKNYRSTEPIVAAANALIRHNQQRCKRTPEEQVRVDSERQDQGGLPVQALQFDRESYQTVWICQQIQAWLQDGVAAQEIAVLARHWDTLSPIRARLERAGITTYALKNDGIRLIRNAVAVRLIEALMAESDRTLLEEESVEAWFKHCFTQWQRDLEEPTVRTLLSIAQDLDQERGFGDKELVFPISFNEILTAIFEFDNTERSHLQENSILVTSCHGAKGLEFRKVILLADGFNTDAHELEAERRLFYVAMTRAKEELVLCGTQTSPFMQETQISSRRLTTQDLQLPQLMLYLDLKPTQVWLGHPATRQQQPLISQLKEGELLRLVPAPQNDGWQIQTAQGILLGALSRAAVKELKDKGIRPGQFQFEPGEIAVRYLYRHLKMDEVTGEILENWSVIIPQIRVCR